jgi:hypothetical protein
MLSPTSFFLAKKPIHLYSWLLEIAADRAAVKVASQHVVKRRIFISDFQMLNQEVQFRMIISLLKQFKLSENGMLDE